MQKNQSLNEKHYIAYVERRLGNSLERLKIFPSYLYIDPHNQCNARCIMCGINFDNKKKIVLGDELFDKIVSELVQYKDHLVWVGLCNDCEPLLDRNISLKIEKLKQAGIRKVLITTNASLLSSSFAKKLIFAGLDRIYISIDSLKKELFEKIRRRLKFEQVYRNILAFIQLRDQLKPELVIRIQMVLQELNKDEVEEFITHWRSLLKDNDQIVVAKAHNWGNSLKIKVPTFGSLDNQNPCIALWSSMVIRSNGEVNLCCVDINATFKLGNVRDLHLYEIWHSKELEFIRKKHLEGKRDEISLCRGCTVWSESKHQAMEVIGSSKL